MMGNATTKADDPTPPREDDTLELDREGEVTENKEKSNPLDILKEGEVNVDTVEPEPDQELAANHSKSLLQSATTQQDTESNLSTDHGISFTVMLNCTGENKSIKEKTLYIKDKEPLTVSDLKLCIQKEFSIPKCCQCLRFDAIQLDDDSIPLSFYHIRDGDTVHVSYVSEGDVTDILEIIDKLVHTHSFIESIQNELNKKKFNDELDSRIMLNVFYEEVNSLAQVYFTPCSSDRAEVNRILFVHGNGVNMLHKLHTVLLKQPWSNTPLKFQYLEHAILRVYWNLTAAFSVRMFVLHHPASLDSVIQSFLRVQVEENSIMEAPHNTFASRVVPKYELDRIACEVVYKALGTLCNLAEIPECRMQIASNKKVLKQLVATLMTPTYKYIASLIAMAGMLCLAYSPETHALVSTPVIIDGILKACSMHRMYYTMSEKQRRSNVLLLKYFACVFFAQVLTISPHLVPLEKKHNILQFMEEFFASADYTEIREEEVNNGYKWSTLIPFMKLAYHPFSHPSRSLVCPDYDEVDSEAMRRLDRCCIQCGIFSLSNVLQCQITREIFVQEGLMDYMVSVPWFYPSQWQERENAQQLVTFLGQKLQLQPPSLLNLTKAHLAATCFGLDKVLRIESLHEFLSEMYTS